MSDSTLVIVAGPPSGELAEGLACWGHRVWEVGPEPIPEMASGLGDLSLVWLHPRARLDAALREALDGVCGLEEPCVATAVHVARESGTTVPLGERVVAASQAAATAGTTGLRPKPGAVRRRLDLVVTVDVPGRVGPHLEAVNQESTAVAALGAAVGEAPSWRGLAVAPLAGTLRGWWKARGDRGRAFTVAFLESFVAPAAAAKLWELRQPEEEPPR